MTEKDIDEALAAIARRVAFFEAWLAEAGGVRDGLDFACHCCGYLYLYVDPDFGDPCPVCEAPVLGFQRQIGWTIYGDDESDDRDVGIETARRNFVLHDRIVPNLSPRSEAEIRRARRIAAAFDAALSLGESEARDQAIVAVRAILDRS